MLKHNLLFCSGCLSDLLGMGLAEREDVSRERRGLAGCNPCRDLSKSLCFGPGWPAVVIRVKPEICQSSLSFMATKRVISGGEEHRACHVHQLYDAGAWQIS